MQILDRASWEVLNATADDWENLEQIYYLVCLEFSPEGYENRDHGAFYLRRPRGPLRWERSPIALPTSSPPACWRHARKTRGRQWLTSTTTATSGAPGSR